MPRASRCGGGLLVAAVLATACGASVRGTSPHATTAAPKATAAALTTTTAPPPRAGAQRLQFKYGPISIQPGQNAIQFSGRDVPKPAVDGWIVRIAPNLRRADGTVPGVDVIHLHHGVWLNLSRADSTFPGPERLFAVGEEKTVLTLPTGFGYRYQATDQWRINYMIHDLIPSPDQVWITYDIDFIPATSPQASGLREVRPIWMDVQNGNVYPVFDALQGTGVNGKLTYPNDVANAYPTGQPLNQWTVDRPGVLIDTAGHLHPGGLYDDLSLTRAGASAAPAAAPAVTGSTALLFRSVADYFEPAGAVSWDVSMGATPSNWRVAVRPGDVLRVSATYDTSHASWYEAMGIMVVWMADGTDGADPFQQRVDMTGVLTHGHLPENNNHGGVANALGDPRTFPTGAAASKLTVSDFTFEAGDFSEQPAPVPTVVQGQPLTFDNLDAPRGVGIWHTITSCAAPCNGSTGIAYPRADASIQFDSGQLGNAGPPTAGRTTWSTPGTLPPGLYTYFCRIHPFMRGAFRVVAAA